MKTGTLLLVLSSLLTGCAHYYSGGTETTTETTTGYGSSSYTYPGPYTSSEMDNLGYGPGVGSFQKPNGQPRFPGRGIDAAW